ncbi:unnamed protein product [Ambrosiozyma monospora]|uniref:Unnamed protein product n=1 Tax=Ambrosiozyma monospora TaxID=43982 RepID=A0ACB5TY78_AMBMO|nr:unnamed protein product [Ambrosiozyma monospora]
MSLQLDSFFPGIRSKHSEQVYELINPDIRGPPSFLSKQLIVQAHSPKISVISTSSADNIAAKYGFTNFLNLLGYFENSFFDVDQPGSPLTVGSAYRITVRFTKPMHVLLKEQDSQQSQSLSQFSADGGDASGDDVSASASGNGSIGFSGVNGPKFPELYNNTLFNKNISDFVDGIDEAIEQTEFLKSFQNMNYSSQQTGTDNLDELDVTILQNTIYLKLLTKIVSSPILSPFETFNHPVIQLFVTSIVSCLLF